MRWDHFQRSCTWAHNYLKFEKMENGELQDQQEMMEVNEIDNGTQAKIVQSSCVSSGHFIAYYLHSFSSGSLHSSLLLCSKSGIMRCRYLWQLPRYLFASFFGVYFYWLQYLVYLTLSYILYGTVNVGLVVRINNQTIVLVNYSNIINVHISFLGNAHIWSSRFRIQLESAEYDTPTPSILCPFDLCCFDSAVLFITSLCRIFYIQPARRKVWIYQVPVAKIFRLRLDLFKSIFQYKQKLL